MYNKYLLNKNYIKMRNIKILASIALISITTIAMAQDDESDNREKMQFGLKAGLNYSNVYDERTDEFYSDPKFGFAGGMFLRIPISKYLGIQPEILYSQKGFKGEGVLLDSEYDFTRTTSYIDVPIQLAFKPSEYLTIVAGPQYSYLVSQKDDFDNTLVSYSQKEEFENDNIRNNILGFVAGLDINIKNIVLSTRMGWDIMNNHGDGTSNTPRYKNMWYQATIGYAFHD